LRLAAAATTNLRVIVPFKEETEVKRFDEDVWAVRIHLTGRAPDGLLAGHADVFREEVPKCRLMLVGHRLDRACAIEALEQKARDFISDWMGRDHSGETGFTEL
jgi:hypothetical protein